jgi:hypothetical protein
MHIGKRTAHWPGAIRTARDLQKLNRRLTRRRTSAAQAINAMKNGAALLMFYEHGRAVWKLSSGLFITPEVAATVTHNPHVAGTGDCLFGDAGTSQTYRWIDLEDEHER